MKNDSNPIIRSEETTIDMHICAALSESGGSGEIYFAAIAPDMELTVITLDEAPDILPCFDEDDADVLNAAFKEYSAAVLNKAERPSVLAKLHDLAQVIANLPDKVRHKEEERGL